MNFFTIVGIFALVGFASAQCGCVKAPEYTVSEVTRCRPETVCSKHVSVVGKTTQVAPATLYARETANAYVSQALPIRVQAPAPAVATVAAQDDLRYRVVQAAPQTVRYVQQSAGPRYDTKVEVPVVPSSVTSTTISLKPLVDRIVVPSPPRVIERRRETVYVNRETPVYVREAAPVYVNTVREAPAVYTSTVREAPAVYTSTVREAPAVYTSTVREAPAVYTSAVRGSVYASPVRQTTVYSAAPAPAVNVVRSAPQVYVNPIRSSSQVVTSSLSGPILRSLPRCH